jgi:hypothetical protein
VLLRRHRHPLLHLVLRPVLGTLGLQQAAQVLATNQWFFVGM